MNLTKSSWYSILPWIPSISFILLLNFKATCLLFLTSINLRLTDPNERSKIWKSLLPYRSYNTSTPSSKTPSTYSWMSWKKQCQSVWNCSTRLPNSGWTYVTHIEYSVCLPTYIGIDDIIFTSDFNLNMNHGHSCRKITSLR